MTTRLEAAAVAVGKLSWADYDHETDPDRDEYESCATAALSAADAHDLANNVHRVSLDAATVERVAESLYHADHGPWVSGHGFTPGGTPWGTSREQQLRIEYISKARAVLAAAVEAR
jgi:hypothetical protein